MNKTIEILKKLLESLQSLLNIYKKFSLSDFSHLSLGKDFTDDKICPDDVSCAFAVSTILKNYFKIRGIDFPIFFATDLLDKELANNKYFKKITYLPEGELLPKNSVIISPRSSSVHGHTGIVDNDGIIMNNNSDTGFWVKSYSRMDWRKKFVEERGLVTHLYKIII